MIKIPSLPLDPSTQEVVSFCVRFQSKEGFMAVYEQELARFKMSHGLKKGVKTLAYESTEVLHSQIFGFRRYPDVEQFFRKHSNFKQRKLASTSL